MKSDYTPNPRLDLLYQAAEKFGFIVDTRGVYPTMIRGQKAAQYTTHRDMLNFISVMYVAPTEVK